MDIKSDYSLLKSPIIKNASSNNIGRHFYANFLNQNLVSDIYTPSFASKTKLDSKDKQCAISPYARKVYTEDEYKKAKSRVSEIIRTYDCREYCTTPERIIATINPENIEIAELICDNDKFEDKAFEIARVMNFVSDENFELAKQLCTDPSFPAREVNIVISVALPWQMELAKHLCSDESFPKKEIKNILWNMDIKTKKFTETLCNDKDFPKKGIVKLLNALTERNMDFAELLCKTKDFPKDKIPFVISNLYPESIDLVKSVCLDKKFPKYYLEGCIFGDRSQIQERINYIKSRIDIAIPDNPTLNEKLKSGKYIFDYYMDGLSEKEKKDAQNIFAAQRQKCLDNCDLYINNTTFADTPKEHIINDFFEIYQEELLAMADIYGKASFDDFFRYRLDTVEYMLGVMKGLFCLGDLQLLRGLTHSKPVNKKDFSSIERVQLLSTLLTHKYLNASKANIRKMVKEGVVDVEKLHYDLLTSAIGDIKNLKPGSLKRWDMKYVHHLLEDMQINKDSSIIDLFDYANSDEFNDIINSPDNKYGKANDNTRQQFQKYGLDYHAWIKPSASSNIKFRHFDENKNRLKQIAAQIAEDMEVLRETPAKSYIDKIFGYCIFENKFKIPETISVDKEKLIKFLQNIHFQLNRLWKRAEENAKSNSKSISENAQNTLTIKNHIEQRLEDLKVLKKEEKNKSLSWKIKMWDRNPHKDIFQGNYSSCCIAMGAIYSSMMPHYLMNTMFNMLEIVDEKEGNIVGNALMYYVKNSDGKPILVIDNIEINNRHKPSDETGIKLRDAITKFAKNINKEVIGDENTPIILSQRFNDVPTKGLEETEAKSISLLGDIDCEDIYLDLFKGVICKTDTKNGNCYKLA